MGVLRLFRYLLQTYKQQRFFHSVAKGQQSNVQYDILCLDLNAIFHPACREVFFPKFKDLLHKPKQRSYEQLEQQAFLEITRAIEAIFHVCRPNQTLYLAIDGVAGMCKQSQQRKRRFRAASQRKPDEFDTGNLTAGTPWMERLCAFLEAWIVERKQTLFNNIKVIYNDMYIEGEGEHKLIRYLAEVCTDRTTYCVYSPDADLIMLCMCLAKGQGYILRENIYDDIQGHWIVVNCSRLKHCVAQSILWYPPEDAEDYDERTHTHRSVKDYVLFLMLIGNDFLPSLYCLEIGNEGIQTLNKCYVQAASTHCYLVEENHNIRRSTFVTLFRELASYEPSLILRKYQRGSKFPDNLLASCIVRNVQDNGTYVETVDFDSLRKAYYTQKFKELEWTDETFETNVQEICRAYVHGLSFVLQYYAVKIPTFEWCYEYHYAPLMIDMLKYVEPLSTTEWNNLQDWDYKPALSLQQALIGIMPPSTSSILQPDVEKVLKKHKGSELFKEEFEVDLQGKQQDYEAVLLLPNVPYKTLKRLHKSTLDPKRDIKFY